MMANSYTDTRNIQLHTYLSVKDCRIIEVKWGLGSGQSKRHKSPKILASTNVPTAPPSKVVCM